MLFQSFLFFFFFDFVNCPPLFLEHMIKEVRHYMEHDGLIEKPVVLKPPDPDDQAPDEVQ